jgi:poly-gamma-glutamate synthase PgsB/CapB
MTSAAVLALLVLLGLLERRERDRAWAAVPLRIHVNGTRGKSTVTRLIRGALQAAGIPAVAKTTGTAARLILPDGTERPVPRRSRPSIREQLWALRMARRAGARAAVLECLALRPELQWVAEHRMVRATIGVITNVRPDHGEVMGRTLPEIAESLANMIPSRGVLVTGDRRFLACFETRAAEQGTEVRVAEPLPPELRAATGPVPAWWAEDAAVALAVTRLLGVPDEVALAGMRQAAPDPGVARLVRLAAGRPALDASAANDPESLRELLASALPAERRPLLLYHHRADRPERLRTFIAAGLPGEFLVTGDPPGAVLRRLPRPLRPSYVPGQRLLDALAARSRPDPEEPFVVLCGNTKGLRLLRQEEGEV